MQDQPSIQPVVDNLPKNEYPLDVRFQDPEWLAWWLSTHFLLSRGEQVAIARSLLGSLHSNECQNILHGFIDHLHVVEEPSEDPLEEVVETSSSVLWRAAGRVLREYKMLSLAFALLLAFYAWRGVTALMNLIL